MTTCYQCRSEIIEDYINFREPFGYICESCYGVILNKRMEKWRLICPAAFLDTEIDKLPKLEGTTKALAWKYGKEGIILNGPTRRGKTRTAWLVLQQVFLSGKSISVLDSVAGFTYAKQFSAGIEQAADWVEKHCVCGLLLLDDVFKAKLTESFESAVFAIVDYRIAHNLPIIATLNDTGETLKARMSSDRGDALVARLKEMCQPIAF